jgi:hypothetical protein
MDRDYESEARREGAALLKAAFTRTRRPPTRRRAPLKDVPAHLRAPKKRKSKPQIPPIVPKPVVPDWLLAQLSR